MIHNLPKRNDVVELVDGRLAIVVGTFGLANKVIVKDDEKRAAQWVPCDQFRIVAAPVQTVRRPGEW